MAAGCGSDGGSGGNPAEIGTLAYVVTECRVAPDAVTVRQDLRILRGEAEPSTVAEVRIGPLDPEARVRFPFSSIPVQEVALSTACSLLGQLRLGSHTVFFFFLQDVAVSPDGSGVVFEVNDNFSPLPAGLADAEAEGIFFVHADGTGIRRLADARTEPSFVLETAVNVRAFAFSPDGRRVVFIDRGPAPEGGTAAQVVTVDVADGARRVLTRLPPARAAGRFPPTCCASFVDDETIAFASTANPDGINPGEDFVSFTVRADGSRLQTSGPPVALPGSVVQPVFSITGDQPAVTVLETPGEAGEQTTAEVFFLDGERLLQLTRFGRGDTITAILGVDRRTVFFAASADPAGLNPTENCQLFSVPTIGGPPDQLTRFQAGEGRSPFGCLFSLLPAGCAIGGLFQDSGSETLVFHSSCDPFGRNPNGDQIFAMRPDGTGLRQLTETAGLVVTGDGETVELPGPYGYPVGPGQRSGG